MEGGLRAAVALDRCGGGDGIRQGAVVPHYLADHRSGLGGLSIILHGGIFTKGINEMSSKSIIALVVMGIIIVALIAVSIVMVEIVTVEGHEIGVLETWADGVVEEPRLPKTYILIPGFTKKIFICS